MSAPDIVSEFAAVVNAQVGREHDFDGSTNASLAQLFSQLAKQQFARRDEGVFSAGSISDIRDEETYWKTESGTWGLLERLCQQRLQARSDALDKDTGMLDESGGGSAEQGAVGSCSIARAAATDFSNVQELMSNTPLLTEYVEVRRWLEETARPFQPVETRKGYLFYTRRSIAERGLLPSSVQKGSSIAERIVTEADPDAASRQRRELVLEDAEYEAGLIRTLYEYVRRGRVANAMDLCIESDEPWRAATLKGGLFWRDPTLEVGNGVLVEDESGERMQDVRPLHTAGNINRTLWKQACAALAHDENNDLYERALYAALSGRLDEVVLVCECWEDYLWAYVNTMIENRIDCGIKDTSLLYTPAQGTSLSNVQSKHPPIRDMQHVFQVLATHDSAAVRRESSLPFHRLQTAIIVNSFPDYISDYAQRLRAKSLSDGECDLLRFVVHTALHLRQLGFALPAEPVNVVLENYIIHLSKSHRELVAIYVAHLQTEQQTEAYAQFLQGVSDPVAVRMQLLALAEKQGLDVDAIAKRTAQIVLLGHIDASQSTQHEYELVEPAERVTGSELGQIRAIEWITSHPRLYEHALVETCKLARTFLLCGRTNAATKLFNALPDGFVQQNWVTKVSGECGMSETPDVFAAAQATHQSPLFSACGMTVSHFYEYIHLLSLCDAYAYYSTWAEVLCKRPAEAGIHSARLQTQLLEWKESATQATERAVYMFRPRLLDIDWLSSQSLRIGDSGDGSSDDALSRTAELLQLRELYIPETVFRLHSILFDTREVVPHNLKLSLDLAQLVADKSLGIYHQLAKTSTIFPHGRLTAFLGLMRRSAFEILRTQQELQPDKPPLLANPADMSGGIA